jgi:hypothetical protein
MADDVQFQSTTPATPAAGVVVATDDVEGVQFQRVKLDVGKNGVSVPVEGALPVSIEQLETGRAMVQALGFGGLPFAQKEDGGELLTQDTNLVNVLGGNSLLNKGRLMVEATTQDSVAKFDYLNGLNDSFTYDVSGRALTTLQISGAWAGTITFEATVDLTNWVVMGGMGLYAGYPASATTSTNGIWRFNTAGIQQVRIRLTAFTAGAAAVTVVASTNPSGPMPVAMDSIYRQLTYDVTLPGLISPINRVLSIAPIAFATQTSYTDQKFAGVPYVQPRLRVESAGSQQMPFAQVPATYELKTRDEMLYRLMEEILAQLMILNGQ